MTSPNDFTALGSSLLHRSICAQIARAGWRDWPSAAQLNAALPDGHQTCRDRPLSFSFDAAAGHEGAAAYEARIAASGVIPLRPRHWHDLFNALMWLSFPATKSALNAIHLRELTPAAGTTRSARRDAVTLLDECGVVLVVDDAQWTHWHRAHDWSTLFVTQRSAWGRRIVPQIIGHGLYEQALSPYIGLTGKALHVRMPDTWFVADENERQRLLDATLSAAILKDTCLQSTAELLPLPILGVPGWCDDNENPSFYANTDYFRARRSKTRT